MRPWRPTILLVLALTVVPADAQQGGQWVPRDDVSVGATPVRLCAANTSRLACVCSNNSDTTAVRLGDDTVGATRGPQLKPGGTVTFTGLGELWAVSETTTSVTVACAEELR